MRTRNVVEALGEKDIAISVKKISQDILFKLVENNEALTVEQVMVIKEVIGG